MKVFLSWSGTYSRTHADIFREWIALIFPDIDFFISSQDIDMGERGIEKIEQNLSMYEFGVIFVSRESLNAPWLYYEAGALSRELKDARRRVAPLLIDCSISEIANTPLSFYQGCVLNREGVERICNSINQILARPRTENVLGKSLDAFWPDFAARLERIEKPSEKKPRITNDLIIREIYDLKKILVRMQNRIESDEERQRRKEILARRRSRGFAEHFLSSEGPAGLPDSNAKGNSTLEIEGILGEDLRDRLIKALLIRESDD